MKVKGLDFGRPRRSTIVLIGLFLGFLALYVAVRPDPIPAGATQQQTGGGQPANPAPTAPATTWSPAQSPSPTLSPSPTATASPSRTPSPSVSPTTSVPVSGTPASSSSPGPSPSGPVPTGGPATVPSATP